MLKKNIKLNNLETKIKIFPIGLSNQNGKATLATKSIHTGASTMCNDKNHLPNFEVVDIDTYSFDNFVDIHNLNIKNIDFIKMDVEGYENHVLEGMQKTLEFLKSETYMFIEIFSEPNHLKQVQHILENNNFKKIIISTNKNFLYRKS